MPTRVKVRVRSENKPTAKAWPTGGDAVFCSRCSTLFHRRAPPYFVLAASPYITRFIVSAPLPRRPWDQPKSSHEKPRCPDCQRHKKLASAVALASKTPQQHQQEGRRGALKMMPPTRAAERPASASPQPAQQRAGTAEESAHARLSPDKGAAAATGAPRAPHTAGPAPAGCAAAAAPPGQARCCSCCAARTRSSGGSCSARRPTTRREARPTGRRRPRSRR